MKIGNNGNLVLGPFDESTPCLMIVLMNCQTQLRINHLTAVKSVVILESNANLNFYTWKKTLFTRCDQRRDIRLLAGNIKYRLRGSIVVPSYVADWNPGKHNVVSRTLLESPEVLFQGCGIDSKKQGNVRRRPGAGRPRATTSSYDRYIQLTARRNRTENATQLQRQLLLATGRRVSSQTARNRLHEGGLYARRPMVCIPLTPHHSAARRKWAAEHRDWE
ncbi:alpha-2 adrenergic receptor [Trichonephila clavipes]|nr:alpha-2 adrenergic receptor [Trichonephila clavipes]